MSAYDLGQWSRRLRVKRGKVEKRAAKKRAQHARLVVRLDGETGWRGWLTPLQKKKELVQVWQNATDLAFQKRSEIYAPHAPYAPRKSKKVSNGGKF